MYGDRSGKATSTWQYVFHTPPLLWIVLTTISNNFSDGLTVTILIKTKLWVIFILVDWLQIFCNIYRHSSLVRFVFKLFTIALMWHSKPFFLKIQSKPFCQAEVESHGKFVTIHFCTVLSYTASYYSNFTFHF